MSILISRENAPLYSGASNVLNEGDVGMSNATIEIIKSGSKMISSCLQYRLVAAISVIAVCLFTYELVRLIEDLVNQAIPAGKYKKSNQTAKFVLSLTTFYGTILIFKRGCELPLSNSAVMTISLGVHLYEHYT